MSDQEKPDPSLDPTVVSRPDAAFDRVAETSSGGMVRGEQPTDRDTFPSATHASVGGTGTTALTEFGRFTDLQLIGRGGMGIVYRAWDNRLQRTVGLKMLAGGLAHESDRQRFQHEAESAAQLDHPGIVPVFEFDEHDGQPYFSMGFVDGESLLDAISRQPLSPSDAASLLVQVAEAIHYAHTRGIIHRDLKPGNILLDGDGQPRVADFGIARRQEVDSRLTATGEILGTPSYMPPEQATGVVKNIGPESDVYSLGAVLYHMLTGRPPFLGESMIETITQVLQSEPVSPRQLRPHVPRDLETICLKCLEKARDRRYSSAAELVDELQRFLDGRPIRARAVTATERAWRWTRRHPIVVALVTTIVIAIFASIGFLISRQYQLKLSGINDQLTTINGRLTTAKAELESANSQLNQSLTREKKLSGQLAEAKRDLEQVLYIRHVGQAYAAIQDNQTIRAQQLLEQCPEDKRHWEWYYVYGLCHTETHTVRGYHPFKYSAIGPDRRRLAYSSYGDATLRIMDTKSGEIARALVHPDEVYHVSYSPTGEKVAGSITTAIIVHDIETGKVVHRIPYMNPYRHSFDPSGKRLAVRNRTHQLSIFDLDAPLETGELPRLDFADFNEKATGCLAWSPDGQYLANGIQQRGVSVWDLATKKLLKKFPKPVAGQGGPTSMAFSPDSRRILVGDASGQLDLWEITTKKKVELAAAHRTSVACVAFSSDGTRIASCAADPVIQIRDAATGELLQSLYGARAIVNSIAFDKDDSTLVAAVSDGSVCVWDLKSADRMRERIWSRNGDVLSVQFTSDSRRLFASSQGGRSLSAVDLDSDELVMEIKDRSFCYSMAVSADDRRLAAVFGDELRVYSVATGEIQHTASTNGQILSQLEFSPEGNYLAGIQGRTLALYDSEDLTLRREFIRKGATACFDFHPHDDLVAIVGFQISAVYSLESGDALFRLPEPRLSVVAFHPEGRYLVYGRQELRVFDLETRLEVRTLTGHTTGAVAQAVFSRDGERLVTAGADGTVRVWDFRSGETILVFQSNREDEQVAGGFRSLAFSPDNRHIAAGGIDNILRLWSAHPDFLTQAASNAAPDAQAP